MSDRDIIKGLASGGRTEHEALVYLYHSQADRIVKLITERYGQERDGHDMLQEAIIVLYEKIKQGQFEYRASLSTFLYRVALNKWIDQLKKKGREEEFRSLQQERDESLPPLEELLEKERSELILSWLNHLKEDCQKILRLAIYENYNMVAISQQMGFKNEQIARNKKNKCLNYLRKIVQDNPLSKTILFNDR